MLEAPWTLTVLAALPLVGSIGTCLDMQKIFRCVMILCPGLLAANLVNNTSSIIENSRLYSGYLMYGSYATLITNLFVSTVIILRLWAGKYETETLMGDAMVGVARIPYSTLISVIVESALPPLLLGILHFILYFSTKKGLSTVSALWISFTVSNISSRLKHSLTFLTLGFSTPGYHVASC
jgi:hypothetical protein